ncbi:glycoside hydrolase [Choiromyces venosus 120613-1]|uniref:glucan 1,3-beta-glucosidase n=1 Tax=Choiromyces venosus 120613-1 TaxID=1336337 RepID=A0A3N4J250_9PEZI|nr:glycoside hydrolase [Choiromyces venosus 120613-1]
MPSVLSLIKSTLLVLPAVVSATGDLGFSLGVKRSPDGSCKTTDDFKADLDTIKILSTTIRVYAASDCNTMQNLMPAVKDKGFKVVLGVWPNDDAHYALEIETLRKYITMYGTDNIKAITVGSEHLYRKELTGEQLGAKIQDVKKVLKELGADSLPVGFADSWNKLTDGAANPAIKESDIILSNAFSYWQGQKMGNATASFSDDIMQALAHIQQVKGDDAFDFWVGETNWPTGGKNFEDSIPSTENARTYWRDAICGIRGWGINVFVFEAFDEHWKPVEKDNDVENHWGVWDSNRKPKYELTC